MHGPARLARCLLAVGWAAVGVVAPATADIPVEGTASVATTVRFDWGPLEGRLARPVALREGDTWDEVARREAGDVRWASTIRAMNGGADAPGTRAKTVWAPPQGRAFDADTPWYSAYLDCSKFGPKVDVSRTGLGRIDPTATSIHVFGHVQVGVLPHARPEDAARSYAIQREPRPSVVWADPSAQGLLAAPAWEAQGAVPEAAPLRAVVQTWRCEGVDAAKGLRLSLVAEERLDAQGRPVRGSGTGAGLATEWVAGLLAALVLFVVARLLVRRWGRGPAASPGSVASPGAGGPAVPSPRAS